jgi:hypothetical protein
MAPDQKHCFISPSCSPGILENCQEPAASVEEDLEFIKNLGQTFFPAEAWNHLSDEEIIRLSEHERHNHINESSILGEEVGKMLGKWIPMFAPPDHQYDLKWMDIWVVLMAGARISLAEECRRRFLSKTRVPSAARNKSDWLLPKAV